MNPTIADGVSWKAFVLGHYPDARLLRSDLLQNCCVWVPSISCVLGVHDRPAEAWRIAADIILRRKVL